MPSSILFFFWSTPSFFFFAPTLHCGRSLSKRELWFHASSFKKKCFIVSSTSWITACFCLFCFVKSLDIGVIWMSCSYFFGWFIFLVFSTSAALCGASNRYYGIKRWILFKPIKKRVNISSFLKFLNTKAVPQTFFWGLIKAFLSLLCLSFAASVSQSRLHFFFELRKKTSFSKKSVTDINHVFQVFEESA